MSIFDLRPGKALELSYPVNRHVLRFDPTRVKRREVLITSIRDLVADPLKPDEFLRRPFLLRSRWLIRAYEPRIMQYRQFYIGTSLEFHAPQQLHLALYEPGSKRPAKLLFRDIAPTLEDRRALVRAVLRLRDLDYGSAQLRIFASDCRLVS